MPLPRREARGFPDVHVRQGRPCPGLSHPCLRVRATCGRAGGLFGTADENRGHFTYFRGHGLPSRGSVSTLGRVAPAGPQVPNKRGHWRVPPPGAVRGGAAWSPPLAVLVATALPRRLGTARCPARFHTQQNERKPVFLAAYFSKIFTRQSNCFEGESFCFERTASEATRPFSPCESVSMTK